MVTTDDALGGGRPRASSDAAGPGRAHHGLRRAAARPGYLLAGVATLFAATAAAQSAGGFVGRAPPATTLEQVDPAVRRYESDHCVQQRARGWGHTGDCDHPAYGGSGAPVIIVTPPAAFGSGSTPEDPRRRPPHRRPGRPDWAW